MATFQLPELQRRIETSLDGLQNFLQARSEPALLEKAEALQNQRRELDDRPLLSLAFSGQYSAGKSTIISALTGQSDIRISADVATDEVKAYRWRDIELWDTPGLFADRADHTAKAEQALREADLIVYCLTTNLFDNVTAADFRRLAFEKGYAPKLFLLVNKLSMEDVDDIEAYIVTLTSSLDRTLAPHQLNDFNHVFIDAQDYREGLASFNQELISFSRFEDFINRLNTWIKERGLLARLDPPIRLGFNTIDGALATLPVTTFAENPELFLLNQQLRIVQSQQRRTEAEVRRIGSGVVQKVLLLGEDLLSGALGAEPEVAQSTFQSSCEAINIAAFDELNTTLQGSYQQLQEKLEDFAKEPFVAEYFASIDTEAVGKTPDEDGSQSGGAKPIKNFAKDLLGRGSKIFGLKDGVFTGTANVAGTQGHELIYNIGKHLGKSFKPWEAVKMAKVMGQAMVFASAAFAIYDVYEQVQEGNQAAERQRQQDQQISEFRSDIRKLAESIAAQIQDTYQQEYDLPVIGVILERLNAARDEVLARETSNKELVEGLSRYRSELKACLEALYGQGGPEPI